MKYQSEFKKYCKYEDEIYKNILFVCLFDFCHKNYSNYKLNILGPLCLWQCLMLFSGIPHLAIFRICPYAHLVDIQYYGGDEEDSSKDNGTWFITICGGRFSADLVLRSSLWSILNFFLFFISVFFFKFKDKLSSLSQVLKFSCF